MRSLGWLGLFMLASFSHSQCVNKLEWSTSGGLIQVNGQPFVLSGVNYFGFETEKYYPHGLWDYDLNTFLDFIKNTGFNAIRVPFSLELVRNNPGNLDLSCAKNPGLCGKKALEVLDIFIDRAAERGLLIMLDNHRITAAGGISDLWYNSDYTEAQVIGLWQTLVSRYQSKWNVFAIDLKNEPHDAATWGNSNPATDWNKAAERIINALSNFSGLFFVEGIEWGNRLEGVAQYPINTGSSSLNNRVIYSPHCYGPDVYDRPEFNTPDFPNNLEAIYNAKYGYIVNATGQPVVVGEWGGKAQDGTRDATWNAWYVDYLRNNCISNNFYWCLNPDSGDTGGLLEDDWVTPIPRKIALVQRAQPKPTKFAVQGSQICITAGEFPVAHCRVGGGSQTSGPTTVGNAVTTSGATSNPTTASQASNPTTTTKLTVAPTSTQGATVPTSATTAGSSGSSVSIVAVVQNSWQQNGRTLVQSVLRITNNGSTQVCRVDFQINAEISSSWNMELVSDSVYRTASWISISPASFSQDAGLITFGSPSPVVVSAQNC